MATTKWPTRVDHSEVAEVAECSDQRGLGDRLPKLFFFKILRLVMYVLSGCPTSVKRLVAFFLEGAFLVVPLFPVSDVLQSFHLLKVFPLLVLKGIYHYWNMFCFLFLQGS